ncbi:MAG: hypothetical protein HC915_21255, partial [Anaerolineae bacterium]|nr:hypothetical protein [Anaerolineae bacterium]
GVVLGGTLWLIAAAESLLHAAQAARPWRQQIRSLPWGLGLLYAAGIAPWYLFAWAYFGTPLPQTFSAKQATLQGLRWWIDGQDWWQAFYGNNPLSLAALVLVPLGLGRALRMPALRPLGPGRLLYGAGYTVVKSPRPSGITPPGCSR